jgi:hypothetical protein
MGAAVDTHLKGGEMARLLSEREVASVRLLTLEISGDEAETYALSLQYMLENLDTETLESITGAYRDEVEGILEDLLVTINPMEWEATPELELVSAD